MHTVQAVSMMKKQQKKTTFGILRHATTSWNLDKRIQGHTDVHLAPTGRKEAESWENRIYNIGFDRILVSDLTRTRQTAEIINHRLNLPITTDDKLREQNWGSWEGKTVKEINSSEPDILASQVDAGWFFCPPGGESRESVWNRSSRALLEAANKWHGLRVLVVTHGGVLKSLIYRMLNRRFLPSEPPIIMPRHLHFIQGTNLQLAEIEVNAICLDESELK